MKKTTCFFATFLFTLTSFGQAPLTLQDIWKSREFSPKYVSGVRSMDDGLHYTSLVSDKGQHVVKYSYKTWEAVDTLVSSPDLSFNGKSIQFSSYSFNTDESKLLLATEEERIYRHSTRAHYFIYTIGSAELQPITDFSKGKQELASLSPTENKVAFVRENNLFIYNLETEEEIQITEDGEEDEIINGAVDWVYEEEFSFHRGFYWSPNGEQIAYYRFDESEVPEFEMAMYSGLYPEEFEFKYPKAGEKNSEVRIFVYSLNNSESNEIDINADPEQYIPRIKWTENENQLAIMRMNRHQSVLDFLLANTDESPGGLIPVESIYHEESKTYIEINDNLIFSEDGKYFFWNSEKDGYNHIYLYTVDGKEVAQLTKGPWDVVEFYGVDQSNGKIFFSAAVGGPLERAIYSADFEKAIKTFKKTNKAVVPQKDNRRDLNELTDNANMNDAAFSSSFDYFINYETGADLPYQIALFTDEGKHLRDLEMNEELKSRLAERNLSPKEFGSFEIESGESLNYWMIKPPNFDESKEYPVMFMVYGGPGKNTVKKSWDGSNYFWHQMLAQQGIVVVSVDPRGTQYRGRDFKHSTYMELGKLETEDMISAAKYFGSKDFIDADRIGTMGWSFGGYLSSLAITKGHEFFKLAIAVAPVTNWRFYDSIYTERFMRTPQENASGYDDNSPINFVNLLEGHYLLIHGSADDNVHLQNTMEMIEALVQADKQFDLFIYPDKNHGIYGGNTRYHLYTKMTNFILDNL
ncbi:MAG: DPP IV N-terminal domain-containing protein [Cryomorphaceae bacterium]